MPNLQAEMIESRDQLSGRGDGAAPATGPSSEAHAAAKAGERLDRSARASLAKRTMGLSPATIFAVWSDWAVHVAAAPGKRSALWEDAVLGSARFWRYAAQSILAGGQAEPCIEPLPQDRRFKSDAWRNPPFNLLQQGFLLQQQWWHKAVTGVRGVSPQHERAIQFATRQLLDVFSPSNSPFTNPEVIEKAVSEGGRNFLRGARHFLEDWRDLAGGRRADNPDDYVLGRDLAATPGKVVLRNELMDLIQYEPCTETLRPEPVLITPAWIMKYYILDLGANNSLVKYLLEQGFTVFMISWKNPGPEDRDRGMDDYLNLGPMAAIDAVQAITGSEKIHAAGYCLGGTLLSIGAAAMAQGGDDRLASISLLAAQTDFSEAGELTLFINESEVAYLEDLMSDQGYLDARQMAGAFQILRSNDLIWSRIVRDYLMGERGSKFDLMAWNADATRMPYRMHSDYLRKLFLDNELAHGKYLVGDRPIALADIRTPIFAVGTDADHVAPWRSVFKIDLLTNADVTFVLTSGGHNAGVVSEPGHAGRHYRIRTQLKNDRHIDADSWLAATNEIEGSWWPEWSRWLAERSGERVNPPPLGAPGTAFAPLCAAPGDYVLGK